MMPPLADDPAQTTAPLDGRIGLEQGPSNEPDVFVFPASFAQSRLWFLDQIEPNRSTYNLPIGLRLRGPLDRSALSSAVRDMVRRHEALRTTFEPEDGAPMQVVQAALDVDVAFEDHSGDPEAAVRAGAALRHQATRPFDLRSGPLARFVLFGIAPEDHLFLIAMHHIVTDGWSIGILFRELAEGYAAAHAGREPALPALAIQYADFALWQRDQLSGESLDTLEAFWRQTLRGPLPVLELPAIGARPTNYIDRPAGRTTFRIPSELATRLDALARNERATAFMLYLAVFQLLLGRYAASDDVVVGSPTAGRGGAGPELESLIGLFVNTLALRTDLSGDPSFRELLVRVRDTTIAAFAHEALPFERVVGVAKPERDTSRTPVFQSTFSLQNATTAVSAGGPRFEGLDVERVGTGRELTKFELSLTIAPDVGGYRGSVEYDAGLYGEEMVERFASQYVTLLESAAAAPDAGIASLRAITDAERQQVLVTFNDTALGVTPSTIHALVATQAARRPDAVALRFDGQSLQYGELEAKAEHLASALRRAGVGPGVIVGLSVERSFDFPLGVLGILKAGGAWMPLDPAYPADRLAYMLEDSGAPLLLTQRALIGRAPAAPRTLYIEDLLAGAHAPSATVNDARPDDLAYVIYTSGSTGRPKGVKLLHRGAVNLAAALARAFEATPDDRILQFSALSFDASVLEIVWSLCQGGRLVLAPHEVIVNPESLGRLIDEEGVTGSLMPPVMLRALDPAAVPTLITVVSGGDACGADVVDRWAPGRRFYNAYGPTEITVAATVGRCDAGAGVTPPIGRPLANCTAYVLDARGAPVPIGVPGELWIGGAGVGDGYLHRPELTAERFVPDPFHPAAGARMYRSGDRVRWRTDGSIDFMGRLDDQVKLRGIRIELGEVEAAVLAQPGVSGVAVALRDDGNGGTRLVAYVLHDTPHAFSADEIRLGVSRLLPQAVVPGVYVLLDALPLTPSGKVDRRALPEPEIAHAADRSHAPPRTTIEHELAQIWETLFPGRRIGIQDDFFEIGGHSLLAVQMLARMERIRGRRVPLSWLFESRTIEALAARVAVDVQSDAEPPIIVLQKDASGLPFAFVHGDVRGGGWYCRRLAPLATPDAPFFVLPTIGADSELLPWTIPAMAAQHIAELRKVQPSGPYQLGGFCAGGIIAYEMARQLQSQGERVDQLVIIDSAALNTRLAYARPLLGLVRGADASARLARQAAMLRRLRRYDTRLRQFSRAPSRARLRWVTNYVMRRLKELSTGRGSAAIATASATASDRPVTESSDMNSALLTDMAKGPGSLVLLMQDRAASAYIPGSYDGVVDLIWAEEQSEQRPLDPTRGWGRVARQVRVHPVPANHIGLITNRLPELGDCLRRILAVNRSR